MPWDSLCFLEADGWVPETQTFPLFSDLLNSLKVVTCHLYLILVPARSHLRVWISKAEPTGELVSLSPCRKLTSVTYSWILVVFMLFLPRRLAQA